MESLNGKWSMQQIDESFVAVLLEAGYSEEAINRLKETTKGDNITFEYKIEGDSVEYILSQDGNEVHKVGGKLGESEQCNSLDGRQITRSMEQTDGTLIVKEVTEDDKVLTNEIKVVDDKLVVVSKSNDKISTREFSRA